MHDSDYVSVYDYVQVQVHVHVHVHVHVRPEARKMCRIIRTCWASGLWLQIRT